MVTWLFLLREIFDDIGIDVVMHATLSKDENTSRDIVIYCMENFMN